MNRTIAMLALVVATHAGCALFSTAVKDIDDVNDPADDKVLHDCRQTARAVKADSGSRRCRFAGVPRVRPGSGDLMGIASMVAAALTFLAEHQDLIEAVVDALEHGTPKEAIKLAIREAKKRASDAAISEEMSQP